MNKNNKAQVGQVISQKYIVLANYQNERVLAYKPTDEVSEIFVVWRLDSNGEPYGGRYFMNGENAKTHFGMTCFGEPDHESEDDEEETDVNPFDEFCEAIESYQMAEKMARVENVQESDAGDYSKELKMLQKFVLDCFK